jgi:hypothetical protein
MIVHVSLVLHRQVVASWLLQMVPRSREQDSGGYERKAANSIGSVAHMVAVQIAEAVDQTGFAVRKSAVVVGTVGFDPARGMEIGVVLDTATAAVLAAGEEAAYCSLIVSEDKVTVFRAMVGSETAHIAEHSRNHKVREQEVGSAVEGSGRG